MHLTIRMKCLNIFQKTCCICNVKFLQLEIKSLHTLCAVEYSLESVKITLLFTYSRYFFMSLVIFCTSIGFIDVLHPILIYVWLWIALQHLFYLNTLLCADILPYFLGFLPSTLQAFQLEFKSIFFHSFKMYLNFYFQSARFKEKTEKLK